MGLLRRSASARSADTGCKGTWRFPVTPFPARVARPGWYRVRMQPDEQQDHHRWPASQKL